MWYVLCFIVGLGCGFYLAKKYGSQVSADLAEDLAALKAELSKFKGTT